MKSKFFELVKMLCIIASISFSAEAQLTELTSSTFIQVSNATSSWGDIDNDGDLDLFISGEDTVTRSVNDTTRTRIATAKLYKNNAGTSFSVIATSIVGVIDGSSNFLDYNGDGNLDLFVVGRNDASWNVNTLRTNTAIAKLYEGNGQGQFTEVFPGTFRGVQAGGTSAVGDYDNDGDIDIFVAGTNQLGNYTSLLYRNDEEKGFFLDTRKGFSSLKGVGNAQASFIDINKDGYLDLFYSGQNDNGYRSYLYTNSNGNSYSLAQDSLGAPDAALAFADYDKNGSIDRFLDGYNYNKNRFYNGITKKDFPLPHVDSSPSAVFTDIDNDGNIELLLAGAGHSEGTIITGLYEYNGTEFTTVPSSLASVKESNISIADVNKDGKVDVLISGIISDGNKITKLYINTGTSTNTVPTKPTGLTFIADSLKLRWTASTDMQENNNITYSLDIVLADSTSGLRKIAAKGDIQTNFAYVNGVSSGVYSARVQTIDVNYAGSEWSDRISFTINKAYVYPAKDIRKTGDMISYTATWAEEPNATSIMVETSTNSDFTVPNTTVVTGLTSKRVTFSNTNNSFYYRIRVTTRNATFVSNVQNFIVQPIAETSLDVFTGVVAAASTFGDYDKDGDLDILVTGGYGENKRSSKLYKNEGDGQYSEVIGTNFVGVENGSSNMMDIDNDGDLDIFITGNNELTLSIHVNGRSRISQVYRNDSRGDTTLFTPIFRDVFEGTGSSSNNFADWDNDGDLDLFLSGNNGNNGAVCRIYQNNKTGFEALDIPFKGIYYLTNGSTTTGDYDNDGDLDFFVTGDTVDASGMSDSTDSKHRPISKLYTNNGGTAFVEQTGNGFSFTPVFLASADFGDYNNDGYLDLIVSGEITNARGTYARRSTILYTNNAGRRFTADTNSFKGLGVNASVSIFGDFNNDGYPDLFLSGSTGAGLSGTGNAKLFFNNQGNGFSRANSDSTTFSGVGARASANFGDIDNDNDLDIFLAGWNPQVGPTAKMYRNNGNIFNTRPSVITLNDVANIDEANVPASGTVPVRFSWTATSDAEQTDGLSYNIYVGEKNNKNSVRSSHSNMSAAKSGIRYVVNRGTIQGTSYNLSLKKGKRYYWSVQAIDASFAGGQWAIEDSFDIGNTSNKMNQIITFTTIPTQSYAGTEIKVTLSATSTSALPVSFSSANTFVAINGNTLTIRGIGTASITAYQVGNANFNAAEPVNQNVVIQPSGTTNINSLTPIEKKHSLIKVYPNPIKNLFHIEVDKTVEGKKYYQFIGINGQETLNGHFTDSNSIQIPALKPGYYVLLVFDSSGGLLQKEKVQVE